MGNRLRNRLREKKSEYVGSKKWKADIRRDALEAARKHEANRKAGRSIFDEYL